VDRGNADDTDDFTLLSKEQYQARWAEYSPAGTKYVLIADRIVVGAVRAG